ncbi:hypothetical protein [Nonomuraea zeae]|uniref:Uncharacterized protein n=1 Tax=Nonomuraea zeae TaxID=1642303 RepID=A0A5S4G2B9_9ACTN|nr:hypothetical protein [Nonomuraea zeae]TMR27155.1 hypothetical protein ETD85_40090 [Nonomuraea zeae]
MSAQHDHHHHPVTFDVHGMLLFGDDPLYFSHLPMFEHPAHRFQVLMEVGFRDDVLEVIRAHRKDGDIQTFVPERFDILELGPSGPEPARTTVAGTIFQGHFERGGIPIAEDVTARIERVSCFRVLDPEPLHDDDRTLTYLCFGRAGRLHLAHEITARPDFDQVLAIRIVPGTVRHDPDVRVPFDVPAMDFPRPVPARFGRVDTPARRLRAGDTLEGAFDPGVTRTGPHGFTAQIEVLGEIYMETGDLA